MSEGSVARIAVVGLVGAYFYLEADVLEFEGVLEAKAEIEILEIKSIVFKDVELGHGISKQPLRHGRGPEGLEKTSHIDEE